MINVPFPHFIPASTRSLILNAVVANLKKCRFENQFTLEVKISDDSPDLLPANIYFVCLSNGEIRILVFRIVLFTGWYFSDMPSALSFFYSHPKSLGL
jgi:hypothetical protein